MINENDAMIRSTRWQNVGNGDKRFPAVYVIEFSTEAFTSSAFQRHGITLPAKMQKAIPKRQAEFLMGRLAARYAINRLGVSAPTPSIGFSREPLWKDGVTGSITHINGMAAAAVVISSTVNGVGIDIEKTVGVGYRGAIQEFVITSSECLLLQARQKYLSFDILLTIAFSAKESFFKGTFATVGRYFDFSAVLISALEVHSGRLTLTLAENLCADLPQGSSFTIFFRMLSKNIVVTSFVW